MESGFRKEGSGYSSRIEKNEKFKTEPQSKTLFFDKVELFSSGLKTELIENGEKVGPDTILNAFSLDN